MIYLPAFLLPSNDGFGSFDILIAATDIKARGGRVGADKINVKLMLSVAVLPHLTKHQFNVNFVNLDPMDISPKQYACSHKLSYMMTNLLLMLMSFLLAGMSQYHIRLP